MVSILGHIVPTPQASPTFRAEFQQLCVDFKIHEKVCTYLLDTVKLERMEDFTDLVDQAKDLTPEVIAKISDLPNAPLMASRLKQAWSGLRGTMAKAHAARAATAASDLDESLEDMSKASYQRYKMVCLLYTSPSPRDGLLSRMPSSA